MTSSAPAQGRGAASIGCIILGIKACGIVRPQGAASIVQDSRHDRIVEHGSLLRRHREGCTRYRCSSRVREASTAAAGIVRPSASSVVPSSFEPRCSTGFKLSGLSVEHGSHSGPAPHAVITRDCPSWLMAIDETDHQPASEVAYG